jgi:histidinol phosphatase-like enzyme
MYKVIYTDGKDGVSELEIEAEDYYYDDLSHTFVFLSSSREEIASLVNKEREFIIVKNGYMNSSKTQITLNDNTSIFYRSTEEQQEKISGTEYLRHLREEKLKKDMEELKRLKDKNALVPRNCYSG